jgi:hypothetical protein
VFEEMKRWTYANDTNAVCPPNTMAAGLGLVELADIPELLVLNPYLTRL